MMPRRRYLLTDIKLNVKRSKTGLGLFAGQDIPRNTCIIEYVGRVISAEEEITSKSLYLFHIKRGLTIDGKPKWNKAGYINHSCKPNADVEVYKNRVYVFSRRKILEGEEILYDYGKEYFDEHIGHRCACVKCSTQKLAKGTNKSKRKLRR